MRDTLKPLLSDVASPRTGRLRRSLFVGTFLALVTLALVVPPAAVGDGVAADEWPWEVQPGEDSDVFPLVGELTFRDEDGEEDNGFRLVGFDPTLHLAVFSNLDSNPEIRLVDTRTLEHLDVIDLDDHLPDNFRLHGVEPAKQMVVDTEHHRLLLPAVSVRRIRDRDGAEEACETYEGTGAHELPFLSTVKSRCDQDMERVPAVITVSLTGEHDPVGTPLELDLEPEEEALDTRIAIKMAYHAPTDKVYAVTDSLSAEGLPQLGGTENVDYYTTLHEFDAADLLGGEAAPASWSYRLTSCDRAAPKQGGFLARSLRADFVYLPCLGSGTGMHGVVVLDLNSGSDPSDTSQFEERFHPFAADLSFGFATGDAANDLIFFSNSAAERHRLFTFDAYHEAWTGASALNDDSGNVLAATSNPETGRIYQLKQGTTGFAPGELRVTEGDRVAVPNGDDYDLGHVKTILHQPGFDPSTRRLFMREVRMCLERAGDGSCETAEPDESIPHFRVFEDRLTDAPRPEPYDFDQDTEDVSDVDGPVFSSAASNATAFGARYLFVGGTQSSRPADDQNIREFFVEQSPFGPSARNVVRAEVDEASLARFTGTPTVVASAVGLTVGEQTGSDVKRNTERDWPEGFPEEMRGYQAYCDDFGGDPNEDAKVGAAVSCDSQEPAAQAGALYTAPDEQSPVQVGYAETSVEVREDDALGAVATATAVARDIDLFGQISIGEIRTEATAVAHGRPGTAATELTREYRQVRVGESFACGWGDDDPCDIWEVVRAINEVTQPRLVAYVPAQDTTLNPDASDEPDDQTGEARVSNATPGGAKAGVTLDPYDARSNETINEDKRTELPGLQIVYYDDHDAVSRHIFQFAAVDLDTYYTVSSAPTFDPPDWADGGGDDVLNGGGPEGGLTDDLGGAATRTVTPPPIVALGEEPVAPTEELELDSGDLAPPTGDTDGSEFETDTGTSAPQQGQAPGLGTADGPTVSTGEDVPAPEVAPDAAASEQAAVAQGEQGGSPGSGGLMLTRQRMGETVPLAALWVLATLPFYLAVRRRRLLASSTR